MAEIGFSDSCNNWKMITISCIYMVGKRILADVVRYHVDEQVNGVDEIDDGRTRNDNNPREQKSTPFLYVRSNRFCIKFRVYFLIFHLI